MKISSTIAKIRAIARRLWSSFAPLPGWVEPLQIAADLGCRSRRQLVVENAILRHQVNVLRRSAGRPRLGLGDRIRLLLGASLLSTWRKMIVVVQPETIIKWHRAGFRLFWRHRSKPGNRPRLNTDTIDLIRDMAKRDRLWGAERIRGELLKLGIKVSKRTIQKYMRGVRTKRGGQSWATFLANHADSAWACDFIQVYDIIFRQVYAFFIVHLGSRKVVYAAASRNPTQAWTAQQLRNATMDGEAPKILLRDRDDKFGASFDRVAAGMGTRVIKTAVRAPDMNAVAERFVGSARREILDHVIVLDDRHLGRIVGEYKDYFNEARPHQGIGQRIPGKPPGVADVTKPIVVKPVLGGLHHDYRRAA
jgi:transposase InsO family protein